MRYLSLFSGIEAASVAWQPLGWTCVAVAEIEPFPAAVLAHHYPDVPNLGDVTAITDEQIAALGPIDVVIGGSPCQDLSVAGKRAGLAGERSGLFHEQLRIFHAARHLCGARYLLWENVPGAFSSNRGRDFAVVVGEMAGCSLPVPPDGWGTEGVVLGEHGLVEWAVLDAQWFGVAQRRRRVFAVLDVGDWASRPPILLERDSLRGDSAPRREAGKGSTAGVIKGAAIGRQPHNGPQYGDAIADGSCYTLTTNEVHAVAHSLRGEGFDASEDGTGRGTPLVPVAIRTANTSANGHGIAENVAHTLDQAQGQCVAFVQNQRDEVRELAVAGALAAEPGAKQQTYIAIPIISDADRSNSEALTPSPDAEGRVRLRNPGIGIGDDGDPMFTIQATKPHMIAFSAKDYGADASDIAPTLRSMGHDGSHANGGGQVAVAFMADDYKDGGYEEAETARPLTTSADRTRAAPVVTTLAIRGRGDSHDLEMRTDGTANALLTPNGGRAGIGVGAIHCGMQVRRLTPVECCRLQGFSDDYLLQVPWRGKTPPDGPMYKALGNSMAVPVMRWIGRQIAAAARCNEAAA